MKNDAVSPEDLFIHFSRVLRTTREAKGMTQGQLARRSFVAPRTIANLESPDRTRKIRFDVIVRLASALQVRPEDWLGLTGHDKPLFPPQIDQVLKKFNLPNFRGEDSLESFFSGIESELKKVSSMLICVCFRTIPSAEHQRLMAEKFSPLVETGKLFLGLICPYPRIRRIETAKKSTLRNLYLQVFCETIRLTKTIRSSSAKKYHQNVNAFTLALEDSHMVFMPTLGLSEFRPIFTRTCTGTQKIDTRYSIRGWLSFFHDEKNRIIQTFPESTSSESQNEASYNIFLAWKDYFAEIVDGCDSKKGWKTDQQHFGEWRMVEIDL